jgi:hypothetical protein
VCVEGAPTMKLVAVIGIVFLFTTSIVTPLMAGDLDKPYNPSRKEWLELSIFKLIKDRTDFWKLRIGSTIWVKESEDTIFVTISAANGEGVPTEKIISDYIAVIRKNIEELIKAYEWSKDLKIIVQFA